MLVFQPMMEYSDVDAYSKIHVKSYFFKPLATGSGSILRSEKVWSNALALMPVSAGQ